MLLATVYKALVFAILCGIGAATEDLVREDRIVVFLFAAPAFWKEVTINAYKNACIHLDNNLFVSSLEAVTRGSNSISSIDGNAQSILIGGHTPRMVLKRKDDWYCTFYE